MELTLPECLYLELSSQNEQPSVPLHTSISLFLLSYCECTSFKVFLVSAKPDTQSSQSWKSQVPTSLAVSMVHVKDLPVLVRGCRLPAVLDETGRYCRAGLAVVLRHIIDRTCEADPRRKDAASLLGFKKTCLKACAEVSQWTRLCELSIPSAVEAHLRQPTNPSLHLPSALLNLEKTLGEPVKVHNDDKIQDQGTDVTQPQDSQSANGLELQAALAKLYVDSGAVPSTTIRESSDIRKVKTTELPQLEHVFAEGLYFTLTDVVLLPCIHQYLVRKSHNASALSQLPLLLRWYLQVQEVPGVPRAAQACGMALSTRKAFTTGPPTIAETQQSSQANQESLEMTMKEVHFVGGPRPTMTKLKESGIEAVFSPHPCPSWTLPWDSLPEAVNPTEGKMSDVRAARKRQQLNNLVAMATELARPGDTVVDFCSGGGHVGIVLAHTLPDCQVILIENKEESLVRGKVRSAELGLTNIGFIQANLDYFTGPFHIGVALHACGVATDMVVEQCIQAGATFVVSPCCYGFVQNTLKFTFPRSKRFLETLSYKEHMILCRFADQTAVQLPSERRLIGKQCMGLVDLDRSWAAETHGYSVRVMTMEPDSCSPKNNMLRFCNGARPSPVSPPNQ
uniref:Glutathione S-transferase C-terminal domain-containing protein n=1 Tax=Oncorhynchus mykiss TaxID=8022 RepID=A0A8K9WVX4_ONCMY